MRGTAPGQIVKSSYTGITPACAGNRRCSALAPGLNRDHPRVCGEQSSRCTPRARPSGSPPRVRGTDSSITGINAANRITPACAGNRILLSYLHLIYQDHPRVCGEQTALSLDMRVEGGSPPRVRGTVFSVVDGDMGQGITPACAGNRLKKARHFYILFCQIKRIHLV